MEKQRSTELEIGMEQNGQERCHDDAISVIDTSGQMTNNALHASEHEKGEEDPNAFPQNHPNSNPQCPPNTVVQESTNEINGIVDAKAGDVDSARIRRNQELDNLRKNRIARKLRKSLNTKGLEMDEAGQQHLTDLIYQGRSASFRLPMETIESQLELDVSNDSDDYNGKQNFVLTDSKKAMIATSVSMATPVSSEVFADNNTSVDRNKSDNSEMFTPVNDTSALQKGMRSGHVRRKSKQFDSNFLPAQNTPASGGSTKQLTSHVNEESKNWSKLRSRTTEISVVGYWGGGGGFGDFYLKQNAREKQERQKQKDAIELLRNYRHKEGANKPKQPTASAPHSHPLPNTGTKTLHHYNPSESYFSNKCASSGIINHTHQNECHSTVGSLISEDAFDITVDEETGLVHAIMQSPRNEASQIPLHISLSHVESVPSHDFDDDDASKSEEKDSLKKSEIEEVLTAHASDDDVSKSNDAGDSEVHDTNKTHNFKEHEHVKVVRSNVLDDEVPKSNEEVDSEKHDVNIVQCLEGNEEVKAMPSVFSDDEVPESHVEVDTEEYENYTSQISNQTLPNQQCTEESVLEQINNGKDSNVASPSHCKNKEDVKYKISLSKDREDSKLKEIDSGDQDLDQTHIDENVVESKVIIEELEQESICELCPSQCDSNQEKMNTKEALFLGSEESTESILDQAKLGELFFEKNGYEKGDGKQIDNEVLCDKSDSDAMIYDNKAENLNYQQEDGEEQTASVVASQDEYSITDVSETPSSVETPSLIPTTPEMKNFPSRRRRRKKNYMSKPVNVTHNKTSYLRTQKNKESMESDKKTPPRVASTQSTILLKGVTFEPLYKGICPRQIKPNNKSSRAARTHREKSCNNLWEPNLHKSREGCERCIFWATDDEKKLILEVGHSPRINRVRGGCSRNCAFFPRAKSQDPVRLCRKCFYHTHEMKLL